MVELQGIHLETTGLGDELDGARAFGGVGVGAQHLVATVDVDLHGAAIHEHAQVQLAGGQFGVGQWGGAVAAIAVGHGLTIHHHAADLVVISHVGVGTVLSGVNLQTRTLGSGGSQVDGHFDFHGLGVIGEGVRVKYEEILTPNDMGDVAIFTELGRFMLAPYGHLISTVIHEKHIYREYVGLDACAANLMRPAMYGAYHHITVLGKEDALLDHVYDVTGGLCENNDKFAVERSLPEIQIGDIVAIHDTGAHGFSMGYNYNGKLRSAEVLLKKDGSFQLIRRAETPEDYFATMVWDD